MNEFAYNNTKNISIGYISFKYNCGYYSKVSFEDKTKLRLRSYSANKLAKELRVLIEICY